MPNVRISDLPPAMFPLSGDELLELTQLERSRKATVTELVSSLFPTDSTFVLVTADPGLANSRRLLAGEAITLTDEGAGGNLIVSVPDQGIDTPKLTDLAVTTAKILNDAVTTPKILDDAITTSKILNDSVTNSKLAEMAQGTIKGRALGAGTGNPTDLTIAEVIDIVLPPDPGEDAFLMWDDSLGIPVWIGEVPDDMLSPNVPLKDALNVFTNAENRFTGALDIGLVHDQCLEFQYGTFNSTGANFVRIAENDAASGRGGCRIWVSGGGGLVNPQSMMFTVHAGFNSTPPSITVVGNESIGASVTSIRSGYDATTQNKYIDILVQNTGSFSVAIESFGIGSGNQWRLGDFSENPAVPSSTYTIDVASNDLMFGVFNGEGETNLAHYNNSEGPQTWLGRSALLSGVNNFLRIGGNDQNFAVVFGANYDSSLNPIIRGFGSTSSTSPKQIQYTTPPGGDHRFFGDVWIKPSITEGNVASVLKIGQETLQGSNANGQLILFGEEGGTIFGTVINQTSGNLQISGTTTGGVSPATSLQISLLVDILSGNAFRIRDATNADMANFSHDGADFITSFLGTTDWQIIGSDLFLNKVGSAGVVKIQSNVGDAALFLKADTSNTVESANPFVRFEQDGNAVAAVVGLTGAANEDAQGNVMTGMTNNGYAIHHATGNGDMGLGVGGAVAILINTANTVNFPTSVSFAGPNVAPAALNSRLTADFLYLDGKEAIDGNDTFLRLNQNGDFSSGVYTPNNFRADGVAEFHNNVRITTGGGSLFIQEKSAATTDVSGQGQWWVLNTSPNLPYFTDDTGNDFPLLHPQQIIQNSSYTLQWRDIGNYITKTSGGSGETITIPPQSTVDWPRGTCIGVDNRGGGNLTIAPGTGVTLLWPAGAGTGSRTLGDDGFAVIMMVGDDTWTIAGNPLS